MTVDNRFLSKREYELANTLAAESNGKYTAEEIRNVMRHTKAQESEKYDSGVSPYFVDTSKVDDKSFFDSSEGKLIVAQDGTGKGRYIVQDIGSIPLDESAKQYLLDQDLGYSFFKVPETKAVEVDFLTGKPINSQNGTYQVSHTIDGKSYVVDYHSCATPECVATNSNMVQNAASDAFIDATSAKALDDASSLGNGVLLITPQGHAIKNSVEGLSLVAGAVEAKLKDEIGKEVINSLIQKAAGKRMADKLGDNISEKANVILDEVGIYDAIVEPIPEDSSIGGDKK